MVLKHRRQYRQQQQPRRQPPRVRARQLPLHRLHRQLLLLRPRQLPPLRLTKGSLGSFASALSGGGNSMKKILSAVAIALLMILSFVAGRRHTARHEMPSTSARHVLYWVDPMHPDYKSDHPGIAPDCGMELEPVYAEPVSASVSPAVPPLLGSVGIDAAKQQLFGIRVASVEKTSGTGKLRVLGRVVPEDTRVFKVDSGMDGFVRATFNDSVGQLVQKNQKLAAYYGADSLAVASGFLAATAGVNPSNNKDG